MSEDKLAEKMIEDSYVGDIPEIVGCARCGATHTKVALFKLAGEKIGKCDHWSICPGTGSPILVSFTRSEE